MTEPTNGALDVDLTDELDYPPLEGETESDITDEED